MESHNLLRRVVRSAAVRAGVPWAGLLTLRHTCASILFRSGWNAKQVQMVLGHHSPVFTLATHVHLVPGDLPEPVFRDSRGHAGCLTATQSGRSPAARQGGPPTRP